MRVSIIIPCFRQAHYLPMALDSCFAQTHTATEIVVVNDGSDDNTEEVARGYGDRIRYVHRQNGGLSAARNTGIAVATGQLLKFLDSDDHLHPEQLEWQVAALADRPRTVAVTTVRAYQEENPAEYQDFVPTIRNLLPDMLTQPDGGIHGYIFPTDLVRQAGGFNENCRIAEEWEFLCRLGRLRVPVIPDPRVGAYYRLRAGSMSTDRSGMVMSVARQLVGMHDEFRDGPNRDWFGTELLGAEQRTYRRLLLGSRRDPDLERELLRRIRELRRLVPHPPAGGKFGLLSRVVGYRLAEHLYASYLKRRTRPAGGAVGSTAGGGKS